MVQRDRTRGPGPFGRHHRGGDARADADTLASLALANLTTVCSFGLLASSGIPVLHAIGVVVAPGALLSLLLSAAFIGGPEASEAHGKMRGPAS